MKETILLYNLDSAAIRNKIKFLCIQGGIHIRVVEKNQYDVPIGTLAFGKKEDMELYLRSESSEEKPSFNDPMLVFAGFTGQKLDQFLNAMRKQKIPKINMAKAIISQFGGPDGETGAAMRYLSQRFSMPYRPVMGVLTDVGIEASNRNLPG